MSSNMSSNVSRSNTTMMYHSINFINVIYDTLLVTGLFCTTFLIFLLLYFKIYHISMRLLFLNIPITYLLILLTNIPVRLFYWFGIMEDVSNICYHIMSLGIILMVNNMFALFFELVISMFSQKHQDSNVPVLSIFLLILEWSFAIAITFFILDSKVFDVTKNSIISGISCGLNLLALGIFPIFERYSLKIYAKNIAKTTGSYTLNHRFGEAENYRNARLLKRVMIILGVMSILMTLYSIIMPIVGFSVVLFMLSMFDIMLQPIIVPILIIVSEERLMRKIKMFLCKNKAQNPEIKPTTITGNPLIINLDQHQDVYFKAYQNAWTK